MGFFSSKSTSSLPQDILAAVHTMKDDLDGKAPTPQVMKASSVTASGSASPFVFSAAPALKNMAPVNENGLTSTITITATDTTNAHPDPKESSPFLHEGMEGVVDGVENTTSPLALDAIPTPPAPPEKPPVTKMYSTLDPKLAPISFAPNPPKKTPSFVSENVTLGSDDPVYAPEVSVKQKSHVLIAGVILLVLALVAGGAFAYFTFVAKKPTTSEISPAPTTDTSLPESPAGMSQSNTKDIPFTLSSPNYLPIDVETVTAEQFRSLLTTKERLLEENEITDTAVEFFITDKNNTPVAFARFAKLLGMTFPQAVMDQIDESFSLYLYSDGGVARVGLALSVKNKDLLSQAVTSGESALPFALQALYLDPSVTKIATPVWKSGTYKSYTTRYVNIAPTGLSNDYTVTDKHWVIGTSANVFRKILDTFGTAL